MAGEERNVSRCRGASTRIACSKSEYVANYNDCGGSIRAFTHIRERLNGASLRQINCPIEMLNLNPVVGRGGVTGFWGAGQGATTRNGATAQGGAVPSEGRCDPVAGCGAITRSRHPLRCPIPASQVPSCNASRRPIPRSCNVAMCRKNCSIRLVANPPKRRRPRDTKKSLWIIMLN